MGNGINDLNQYSAERCEMLNYTGSFAESQKVSR